MIVQFGGDALSFPLFGTTHFCGQRPQSILRFQQFMCLDAHGLRELVAPSLETILRLLNVSDIDIGAHISDQFVVRREAWPSDRAHPSILPIKASKTTHGVKGEAVSHGIKIQL